jgi:hypothetical protein
MPDPGSAISGWPAQARRACGGSPWRNETAEFALDPAGKAIGAQGLPALPATGAVADSAASLWRLKHGLPRGRIVVGPRVGISQEMHRPLRFFEKANPFVSGRRG